MSHGGIFVMIVSGKHKFQKKAKASAFQGILLRKR